MSDFTYRDITSYKYQLMREYVTNTGIKTGSTITNQFIELTGEGILIIQAGYAWDGCSGPTWDDDTNLEASLPHDGLYQLTREGLLDYSYREAIDDLFKKMCKENGMGGLRAWYYHKAVRWFGGRSAKNKK